MAFKMRSPLKHAPYAKAHTRGEGKVSHQNTAEAHGKKTEDYYDGSKGKEFKEKEINNTKRNKKVPLKNYKKGYYKSNNKK